MLKKRWLLLIVLAIFLTSCGGSASFDPVEVVNSSDQTFQEKVETLVLKAAGTQTSDKEPTIGELRINDHYQTGDKIILLTLNSTVLSKNTVKRQIFMKSKKIFEYLYLFDNVEEVTIFWKVPFTDTYGNETYEQVMKISVDSDAAQKINWSNIDTMNMEKVATQYWEHSVLRN